MLKEHRDPTHFTNTFQPPAPYTLKGNALKTLEGGTLKAGQFTFLFTDHEGVKHSLTNASNGTIALPEITLTQEGTYTFRLVEEKASAEGITYDSAVYDLNLTLSTNEDNALIATAGGWTRNGQPYSDEAPVFLNTQAKPSEPEEPTPGYPTLDVPLTAKKVLNKGALRGGEFAFVLKDAKGSVLAQVGNLADGTIVFPNRTFSRVVKDYTYTISEPQGSDPNIVYDRTVYTVKVSTTAVGGLLEARVDVLKDGTPYAGDIVFVNQRKVPPTGDSALNTVLMLLALSAVLAGGALTLSRQSRRKAR